MVPAMGVNDWLMAAIAVLSLWLRAAVPVTALPFFRHDDALFVSLARSIAAGQWLGPFDNLTLAKGPAYPLFVAAVGAAGVPLKIGEQAFYLGASAILARVLARRCNGSSAGRLWFGIPLFAALAFNPVLWRPELARVIRDGLYIGLTLLVFALVLAVVFPAAPRRMTTPTAVGAILGVAGAAYWITREEGVWLVPALCCVTAVALSAAANWPRGAADAARSGWSPHDVFVRALPVAAAAVMCAAVLLGVASINRSVYGVFQLNDIKAGGFVRAYGAISRIKPDHWQRYVVFPRDARERAYAVSPTLRELKPYLDGQLGDGWRDLACSSMGLRSCPEILSGWFLWALRDAAAAAGYYRSARRADEFYRRIADEINEACARGALACLPPRTTIAPPFRLRYVLDTLRRSVTLGRIVFGMGDAVVGSLPSQGASGDVAVVASLVGPVASNVGRVGMVVQGWAIDRASIPEVSLQSTGQGTARSLILISDGADVARAFPGFNVRRFSLETDCLPESCSLVIAAGGKDQAVMPLARIAAGSLYSRSDSSAYIDRASVQAPDRPFHATQLAVLSLLARLYSAVCLPLSVLACLGALTGVCRWRRRPPNHVLLAAFVGSAAAVAVRIMLLAYLDVTSLPAANSLYASSASPFVIVLIYVGFAMGWRSMSARPVSLRPA